MKRKQFLHRLLQISELNDYLNPLKDIPLIFSKPFKIEHRGDNRETHLCNLTKQQFNPQNHGNQQFRHGEVLIITQNGANNLVTKIKATKRNDSKRRLKSVPAHPNIRRDQNNQQFSMQATDYMLQQSSDRKFSFASVEMKHKVLPKTTHFMSISEIRPQVSPTKKLAHRQLMYSKRGLQNIRPKEFQKDSVTRKHSIMEVSCEQNQQRNVFKTNRIPAKPKKITEVQHITSNKVQTNKTSQSLNQTVGNESREEQRKAKINLRKQINKNYTKPFIPPPKLTAKSYIVYEIKTIPQESKVIVSFNCKLSQQVASLTKIMTCIITLEICKDFCIDKYATEVTVGRMETSVGGTTADLEEGQVYTIQQLLYGLMLPSGNDASVALAVWGGGKLLQNQRQPQQKKVNLQKQRKRQTEQLSKYLSTSCISSTAVSEYRRPTKSECYGRFIQQMNNKAKLLNLSKTTYANSHGLMNTSNKSSAFDIAILCEYAMKNESFRTIVHCRNFKTTIKVIRGYIKTDVSDDKNDILDVVGERENYQKSQVKNQHVTTTSIEWQNTHKLLHLRPKEYLGIKTGFTTAAGPCLASCVSVEGRQFIIVVLGCERMSFRFHETQILKKWLYKHENITRPKAKHSISSPDEGICEYEREQGVPQANLSSILKQLARQQQIED